MLCWNQMLYFFHFHHWSTSFRSSSKTCWKTIFELLENCAWDTTNMEGKRQLSEASWYITNFHPTYLPSLTTTSIKNYHLINYYVFLSKMYTFFVIINAFSGPSSIKLASDITVLQCLPYFHWWPYIHNFIHIHNFIFIYLYM